MAGGVAYAEYIYSMTGIYDPNITGVGHQPRGHDQWMNIYTTYRVRGFRVRIEGQNYATDTSIGEPQVVGTFISDSITGAANMNDMLENPTDWGFQSIHWKTITRAGVSLDRNTYKRTASYNLQKVQARLFSPPPQIATNTLYTNMGANPSTWNVYFTVFFGNVNGGLDTVSMGFIVYISYLVELVLPIIPAQS